MARPGLDADIDLRKLRGSFDLGWNGTGVIRSKVHFTGDEIIIHEEMPGAYVQQCMDEVHALSDAMKRRRPGGKIRGRVPLPIYFMWRRAWEKGPKLHGVLWKAYLNSQLMDRDYSRFRVEGV